MSQDEDALDHFMAGISLAESGSTTGVYDAENPSGAYGRYQIMPQYWDGWADEAGISGANIRDPAAQDRVARYKLGQYYDTYGSWDLAAMAWRLGPSVAERVQTQGWGSLTATERDKIEPYLDKVMPYTGEGPYRAPAPVMTSSVIDQAMGAGNTMVKMFNEMSKKVAGGVRVPVNQLASITGVNTLSLAETNPETIDEQAAGGLGFSTTVEGDELYISDVGSQSWSSSWDSGHTLQLNADRLADDDYQAIATGTTSVIGQWLVDNMGVNVSQYRPLNFRPQGGAADSDHYWGGALDVTGTYEQMNAVSRWVDQYGNHLGIDYKLWQTANHYDHVHISFLAPGSDGAVTDGNEALIAAGLIEPLATPLRQKDKTQTKGQVGADVGAYTVPQNVR